MYTPMNKSRKDRLHWLVRYHCKTSDIFKFIKPEWNQHKSRVVGNRLIKYQGTQCQQRNGILAQQCDAMGWRCD